jgi:hypothetical protein
VTALTALLLAAGVVAFPVAGATVVLTYHGWRGTNPGPAALLLLQLVQLVLIRSANDAARPVSPAGQAGGAVDMPGPSHRDAGG